MRVFERFVLMHAWSAKRVGEMDEISNVAVFLASDQASYITGQDITIDGGLMAMGQWAN
jgi:NAD(P)-dependent dehydrogenase (short-subunit alcohol dehydrogenase family)